MYLYSILLVAVSLPSIVICMGAAPLLSNICKFPYMEIGRPFWVGLSVLISGGCVRVENL